MSKWLYTLELSDLWRKHEREEINIPQLAKEVADRVLALSKKMKNDKRGFGFISRVDIQEYAEELSDVTYWGFMYLFEGENEDVEDFDYELSLLYDIGDVSLDGNFGGVKLIWINTFGDKNDTNS